MEVEGGIMQVSILIQIGVGIVGPAMRALTKS